MRQLLADSEIRGAYQEISVGVHHIRQDETLSGLVLLDLSKILRHVSQNWLLLVNQPCNIQPSSQSMTALSHHESLLKHL